MNSLLKVLLGSVMHVLVHSLMPDSTAADNTVLLWKMINDEYELQKTPCKYGQLKLSMFNPKGGAFLF